MPTFYIDLDNGNDANDGSTWALAWKTITTGASSGRLTSGDIVRISKTPDPVSVGNATWTDESATVTLAAAQTLLVDNCESAWTAANSASVALTASSTDGKQGSYCMRITPPASPATGTLYAYFALSSQTNYGAYDQLTFWFKNAVAVAAGNWKVCLCSDTAGTTIVDSFEIPAISSTTKWVPFSLMRSDLNKLGDTINSIAIYSSTVAPTGSQYIQIDNINASLNGYLNLNTLISKNGNAQGGDEAFYCIQSINGTTIILDGVPATLPGATWPAYSGTTETVATYIRIPFLTPMAATTTTSSINALNDTNIDYQFGFEVGTTNQNGETYFDGRNGNGYGIYSTTKPSNMLNFCSFSRYYYGMYFTGATYMKFNTIPNICSCVFGLLFIDSRDNDLGTIKNIVNFEYEGVTLNGTAYSKNTLIKNISSTSRYGIVFQDSGSNTLTVEKIRIAEFYGIRFMDSALNKIIGVTISNCDQSDIYNYNGINYLVDAACSDTSEIETLGYNSWIWSLNHDKTIGNNVGFTHYAKVFWQTTTKHLTEPGSWETTIENAFRISTVPVKLKIAEVAFAADSAVTFTAWVKKDHASNIGARLITYANSSFGITEQYDTKTDDTDWEQLSITFTPTEAGVTEVYVESWYIAGLSNTYVGSIDVTQV